MKQVLIIHGGESYPSYDAYIKSLQAKDIDYESLKLRKKWKPWVAEQLQEVDVLLPAFPNGYNAVYEEWKIYFEKLIPLFSDNVQLVGHSLGAMFLARYLHDNRLEKKVYRLILIAGVYDHDPLDESGEFLVHNAKHLEESAEEIHLFHSQDDPVVPFTELAKFQSDLPNAISHVFEDRGHFNDATFPELLELLKQK